MALKLKCGSTFASITWISLARLPDLISLSLAIRSTTSSVTFFTSTSGASCARAVPRQRSTAAPRSTLTRFLVVLIFRVVVIFRILLSWRMAVVDQAAAALQVRIALEHVSVERRFLEDAARVEEIGARLGEAQDDQPPARFPGIGLIERIGVEVESLADTVAHGARAEHRQHEVRPRPGSPPAEGLAEVLVVLFVAHVGRDIVNA